MSFEPLAPPAASEPAISVALVEDGQPTAGAVALPAVGVTHSTAEPPQILAEPNRPPRLAVSRSRPLLEAMASRALDTCLAGATGLAASFAYARLATTGEKIRDLRDRVDNPPS